MSTVRFDRRGLQEALRNAQSALAARGAGEAETWLLPEGRHSLSAPLVLGMAERHLTIRGVNTVLVLSGGAGSDPGLRLVGSRLSLSGIALHGDGAPGPAVAMEISAGISLRVTDVVLHDLTLGSGDGTGLHLRSPSVHMQRVTLDRIGCPGDLTGIDLSGSAECRLEQCRIGAMSGASVRGFVARRSTSLDWSGGEVSGLAGDRVTGLLADVRHVALSGLELRDLAAATGFGLGLDVTASAGAEIADIAVIGISGRGVPGTAFDDLTGDGAGAIRLSAPAGRVFDVRIRGLSAPEGRAVALRLPDAVQTSGLSIGRALDGADLAAALSAAQDDLLLEPAGSAAEWQLPAGVFRFDAGLAFGDPDRSLVVRGAPPGEGGTRILFEDGGGAIAGDVAGLTLTGRDLTVEDLAVGCRATGAAVGLIVNATGLASLMDVTLSDIHGASVAGIRCSGSDRVEIFDTTLRLLRAGAGDAVGMEIGADIVVASSASVDDLRASGQATGLALTAGLEAHLSLLSASDVSGSEATGVLAVMAAAAGTLSVLDLRVRGIAADGPDRLATGVALVSAGDVEVRALAAERIAGERALGALISAIGAIDWRAGEIRDIFGRTGGAAAVRIIAGPSQVRDAGQPGIAVHDLACEAVRAAATSGRTAPPDSWLAAAPTLASDLAAAAPSLAALPAPGTAGHLEEIVGLSVHAPVSDFTPWVGSRDPASVAVENCVFRRISGTVLQLDCGLRDIGLRGSEAWTGVGGGWVSGERALLANLTWDRMATGLDCTDADVHAVNCLVTRTAAGAGIFVDQGGSLSGGASFVTGGSAPLAPEPDALPYVNAGPASPVPPSVIAGALAPAAAIDLSLVPGTGLHDLAETVPGEDPAEAAYMGAVQPAQAAGCILIDPAPPAAPEPPSPSEPSPFVDYRTRDGRGFLEMMRSRASVVMPEWETATPADFTTMLIELLASELDIVSYRQEEAVANGYLGTATLRRALEDHARLVDHRPDPGHSATAMVRFSIGPQGAAALGLDAAFAAGETLTIPRGTMIVNPDATDISLIFATEHDLVYDPRVSALELHEDEEIEPGALSALLAGDVGALVLGRWLTILGTDPDGAPVAPHVVRVVSVQEGTDRTRITWDPRRPAPDRYRVGRTIVKGNVVPAHHGVPLTPLTGAELAIGASADPLAPWREMLRLNVAASGRRLDEIALPLGPVSIQSTGWLFPNTGPRVGRLHLSATLDGTPLRLVDDLSEDARSDPRMALRPAKDGGPGLAIAGAGDGGILEVAMTVGLGALGNVGAKALTRILAFGTGADLDRVLADRADRLDVLQSAIAVTNDIPAVGGRDPDGIETVRARAPLALRRSLSAVAPRDYERLLTGLEEVAAARARPVDAGLRRVIRVTALLADEDELTRPELGDIREAERYRRWALARRRLEDIRLMGFDLELLPPEFVPLDIDLAVDIEDWANADTVRRRIDTVLQGPGGLFDPDVSGLGGDVSPDAIQRAVLAIEGVRAARLLRLRRLAPSSPDYARAAQMPIGASEVAVLASPYGAPHGILTIETCGGMP